MLEEKWPQAAEQLTTALAVNPNSKVVQERLQEIEAVLAHTAKDDAVQAVPVGHTTDAKPAVMDLPVIVKTSTPDGPSAQPASYTISDEGS